MEKRIAFDGHMARINTVRYSNKIFIYIFEKKTKEIRTWFTEIEIDLIEIMITFDDVWERDLCKIELKTYRRFQEKSKLRTGKKWTEVRKQQHGKIMRQYCN